MSKAIDALRERLRIFNPHNAATFAHARGGVGVIIVYRARQTGRAYQSAAWQVVNPREPSDPNSHWSDYGNKTFGVYGRVAVEKPVQEQAARDWASERYGVEEWVKVPGLTGALFPAQDAEIIKAALREAQR